MSSSSGDGRARCGWAGGDALYVAYHDREWGRPVVNGNRLFEKLCLEGFQAGLSWLTILRKRDAFRAAFAHFDPALVTDFDDDDVDRLLHDAGIVRHRAKIVATINNARRAMALADEFGSIGAYVWSFEPTIDGHHQRVRGDIPSITAESTAMSKDLKGRGWSYVGPTTVYAFMQAMGLVNDHVTGCWARDEVENERRALVRPTPPGDRRD
ncbi:MAG: DNA-3-methyladenine glycosylase I [Acidimicrobiales bacterium]